MFAAGSFIVNGVYETFTFICGNLAKKLNVWELVSQKANMLLLESNPYFLIEYACNGIIDCSGRNTTMYGYS